MLPPPTILWVEDDYFYISRFVRTLVDQGYNVIKAGSTTEARQLITDNPHIKYVILDVMLPDPDRSEDPIETQGGRWAGIVLASWIKRNHPAIRCLGFSVLNDFETKSWFRQNGYGFAYKLDVVNTTRFLQLIQREFNLDAGLPRQWRVLIVHGQDEVAKYSLKNYLQNSLNLGEPVILHEQPSLGRTIIEKFEDEADKADVVFVLLTPDDQVVDPSTSDAVKRRARQNVIFELGYFYAKFQRRKGRVILLHKGPVELPSDIAGLVYIDIQNGIEAAGEAIRRELEGLLNTD